MKKNLIKKVLIIAVPTYAIAIFTNAMVYTMPMLAITTIIATNIFQDDRDIENRVDEEGDSSDDDGDGNGFGVAFGVNQNSTIWDTQDGMAGFYTKALSLPNLETQTHTVTTSHSSTATEATTTEGARYTVAFRVKPLLQAQEFAIVAHEYDTDLGPSTSGGYIKAATGTNPTTPVGGSYTSNMTYAFGEKHGGYLAALGMEAFTATRNIILDVLKLSDSGDSSRQAFESCSADAWHTVGGTYTATGTAKCVSFSLLARTNPTSTTVTNWITTLGGLYTNPSSHASSDDGLITTLCDFAYMEPQLMNADMVENIAALRAAREAGGADGAY